MQRFTLPLHVTQLIQNVVGFQHVAQLPRNKLSHEGAAAVAESGRQTVGAAVGVAFEGGCFVEATHQLIAGTWSVPENKTKN
jgi:hypothetical protein